MKKVTFILLVLLINSCSNHAPLNTLEERVAAPILVKKYSTSTLIKEKFLEFYDLHVLLKNKPQFQDDIKERLKNFTLDTTSVLYLVNDSKIENIQQKGALIKISDSIQKTKLVFDIRTKNQSRKDSIFGFLFKKEIVIDSVEVISTKVKFSRY